MTAPQTATPVETAFAGEDDCRKNVPMHLQVTYCNHHTADLNVRERLAFSSDDILEQAYHALRENFPASETVVISTCNRIELYTAQSEEEHSPTPDQIANFFSDFHRVPLDEFAEHLLSQTGPDAVRHLFQVVSSLDSMVLGEPQIVKQVKDAYETAKQNESCGPLTHSLFQAAMSVSGRVRSDTKLSLGRVSIASVAVGDFAKSIFDRFDDKLVLIIGAGEMAEETLRYLKDEGVNRIVVVNRSVERAEDLASRWGGEIAPYDDLDEWMAKADVIVSTTGARQPIVDAERFSLVRKQSDHKPVFILDLGAPRDFAPGIGRLDDQIFLFDIDDLEATCEKNRKTRKKEVAKAEKIIEEETEKFTRNLNHRATGPIIRQLREGWDQVKEDELALLFRKLQHLDGKDRELIERAIDRIINKLLHPPLEALKDEARQGHSHGLINALKHLFHLRD